jgi:hypothetical protein
MKTENTQEEIDKFWLRVAAPNENGCRLWTGAVGKKGYGNVVFSTGHENAHRAAFIFTYGMPPTGKIVRHTCDVRLCCEPTHLLSGTHAENTADMVSRGRAGWQQPGWSEKISESWRNGKRISQGGT